MSEWVEVKPGGMWKPSPGEVLEGAFLGVEEFSYEGKHYPAARFLTNDGRTYAIANGKLPQLIESIRLPERAPVRVEYVGKKDLPPRPGSPPGVAAFVHEYRLFVRQVDLPTSKAATDAARVEVKP